VFGFLAPSGQTTYGPIQGVLVLLLVSLEFVCCVYFQYLWAAFVRYSVYLYIQIYLPYFSLFLCLVCTPPFHCVRNTDPRVAGEEEGVVHCD
jgi:hypothetical protein